MSIDKKSQFGYTSVILFDEAVKHGDKKSFVNITDDITRKKRGGGLERMEILFFSSAFLAIKRDFRLPAEIVHREPRQVAVAVMQLLCILGLFLYTHN